MGPPPGTKGGGSPTKSDVTLEQAKRLKAEALNEHFRWLVMFSQYSLSGAKDQHMLGALACPKGFPNMDHSRASGSNGDYAREAQQEAPGTGVPIFTRYRTISRAAPGASGVNRLAPVPVLHTTHGGYKPFPVARRFSEFQQPSQLKYPPSSLGSHIPERLADMRFDTAEDMNGLMPASRRHSMATYSVHPPFSTPAFGYTEEEEGISNKGRASSPHADYARDESAKMTSTPSSLGFITRAPCGHAL
jgi:hypothetical protein